MNEKCRRHDVECIAMGIYLRLIGYLVYTFCFNNNFRVFACICAALCMVIINVIVGVFNCSLNG